MKFSILFTLLLLSLVFAEGEDISMQWQGQVSIFHASSFEGSFSESPTTLRYIPQMRLDYHASSTTRFGFDAALDLYNHALGDSLADMDSELYRFTLRYDTPNTQVRIGLQKINFGPARMLRVLQWFDELDPRDPLALSPGIWAAMGRYYFENGANLRLWGMQNAPNAWRDMVTSSFDEDSYDFGGRIEYPLRTGTLGFTTHIIQLNRDLQIYERRYAVDVRADLIVGCWTEIMYAYKSNFRPAYSHVVSYTFGTDYTFDLGNGLYAALEVSGTNMGSFETSMPWTSHAKAVSLNYTLGLADGLTGYLYLIETPGITAQYIPMLGWQHTSGNWLYYLALYDMPEMATGGTLALPTGTGIQLNVAFNH